MFLFTAAGPICLKCDRIQQPYDCDNVVRCGSHEVRHDIYCILLDFSLHPYVFVCQIITQAIPIIHVIDIEFTRHSTIQNYFNFINVCNVDDIIDTRRSIIMDLQA